MLSTVMPATADVGLYPVNKSSSCFVNFISNLAPNDTPIVNNKLGRTWQWSWTINV